MRLFGASKRHDPTPSGSAQLIIQSLRECPSDWLRDKEVSGFDTTLTHPSGIHLKYSAAFSTWAGDSPSHLSTSVELSASDRAAIQTAVEELLRAERHQSDQTALTRLAQGMSAGTAETLQAAQGSARQPGPATQDAPNHDILKGDAGQPNKRGATS